MHSLYHGNDMQNNIEKSLNGFRLFVSKWSLVLDFTGVPSKNLVNRTKFKVCRDEKDNGANEKPEIDPKGQKQKNNGQTIANHLVQASYILFIVHHITLLFTLIISLFPSFVKKKTKK
jgi:hypothetical protein